MNLLDIGLEESRMAVKSSGQELLAGIDCESAFEECSLEVSEGHNRAQVEEVTLGRYW